MIDTILQYFNHHVAVTYFTYGIIQAVALLRFLRKNSIEGDSVRCSDSDGLFWMVVGLTLIAPLVSLSIAYESGKWLIYNATGGDITKRNSEDQAEREAVAVLRRVKDGKVTK